MLVEKLKCLGVAFASDERQDKTLDILLGKATDVIASFVIFSRLLKLSRLGKKFSIFHKPMFGPISHLWS